MKALRLDSCKAFVLISPSSLLLALLQLQLLPPNALGRLLFIGVWGWVSDTWRSPIGDTCHGLIGLPMSSLTRARSPVSSLTRAGLPVSSLTRAEV